jgi:hypothetical protein
MAKNFIYTNDPSSRVPNDEPPPLLKSWKNLYLVVLGNLLLWIALFTLFTWMFK